MAVIYRDHETYRYREGGMLLEIVRYPNGSIDLTVSCGGYSELVTIELTEAEAWSAGMALIELSGIAAPASD